MKTKKGRKGWLVTWESFHGRGEYLEQLNLPCFVCVLPPNLKRHSVQMIMRTLWSMWEPSLKEKVVSGASPRFPREWIQNRGWTGPIMFGYDPFLTARRVDNLRVTVSKSGGEDLHFVIHGERDVHDNIIPPRSCVLKHGQRRWEIEEHG